MKKMIFSVLLMVLFLSDVQIASASNSVFTSANNPIMHDIANADDNEEDDEEEPDDNSQQVFKCNKV